MDVRNREAYLVKRVSQSLHEMRFTLHAMYQIIDHTADVGIKVEALSQGELFVSAAEAMFDLMFIRKRSLIPSIEVMIEINAPAMDQLLVRWLQELLFVFESRRLVFSKFWIDEISDTMLRGSASGLKFDSTRHTQKLDIKAVTYHHIEVREDKDGNWHASVIFDI